MKPSFVILTLLGFLLVSFVVTGFQCGSPSLTSAKLYINNTDWENAEKSLTAEVEKNPANAEAWYLLGNVRLQRRNFAGMVEAYDKSAPLSPEFAEKIKSTKSNLWVLMMQHGIGCYNHSLKVSADSVSMFRDSAITDYQNAIVVAPDSIIGYQNLALAQHANSKYDDEINTLKIGLERKKDPEVYATLINVYIQKAQMAKTAGNNDEATKNYDNAIASLTEARALQPDNIELLGILINLYIETGRAKDAVPLIREAITKDPQNKVFQNDLGLLLMQTEEFEEATQHFEAAIATDPTYEDALWNGAIAYMKWGDKVKKTAGENADAKDYVPKFKSAVKLTEKLVALKKDEAKYWEGLGTAYANAGMTKEAQKAYEQAAALEKK